MFFDHEKLDVYQVSLNFVSFVSQLVVDLKGDHRSAKDQLIRASQSVSLNIAEGNGKRSPADRKRFFEIARGSAMESAAVLDILIAVGACAKDSVNPGKGFLVRIVSMLSKMTEHALGAVRETESCYGEAGIDYDYDYDYEHEHEHEEDSAVKHNGGNT